MKEKWIEAEQMKRLTMDNLEEMGMFSLAHTAGKVQGLLG